MQDVGAQVREWLAAGRDVAVARVLELQGFSTWAGDPLVAVADDDGQAGQILGRPGSAAIGAARARVTGGGGRLERVSVSIHGDEVAANGLVCGGQADLLVQPAAGIPGELWAALAARAPVALVTRVEGPTAGPASLAVLADGSWHGELAVGDPDHLAAQATALFTQGSHGVSRVEDGAGVVLIEAWVPDPRLVVIGAGDLVDAIGAQAGLLGWELRAATDPDGLVAGLDWAGGSAALVVLSHDAGIDTVAIRLGLDRRVPYVGAMGSRRTQSRRLDTLRAEGVAEETLERIHRPIGLDLGGRRPPEVALAIVAEILAVRSGRDGRPLKHRDGPIHAPAAPVA
jgi:xanthine dehydrogenase accessory factor